MWLGSCCLDGPATGSSASETGGVVLRILWAILTSSSGSMGGFSSSVDSSVSCILFSMGVLGWYLELPAVEAGLRSPGPGEAGGWLPPGDMNHAILFFF